MDSAPHLHFASLDSTNNYASKIAKLPETRNGTAISADFQTAGRGQRGTTWEAPENQGFLVSLVLFPKLHTSEIFYLSKFVAICLQETLTKLGIEGVQIKWPNDILINSRKLAGILIENTWSETSLQHSIVGIGLNCEPNPNFPDSSTSLADHIQTPPSLTEYVKLLQEIIQVNWRLMDNKEFKTLDNLYHKHLYKLNILSSFQLANNMEFVGTIKQVAADGGLCLSDTRGNEHQFYLKEIKFA